MLANSFSGRSIWQEPTLCQHVAVCAQHLVAPVGNVAIKDLEAKRIHGRRSHCKPRAAPYSVIYPMCRSKFACLAAGVLRATPVRLLMGARSVAVWTLGFALVGFGVVVIAIMGGTSLFAGDTNAVELPGIAAWLALGALSLGAVCIAFTVWRDRVEAAALPDERPNRKHPDSN